MPHLPGRRPSLALSLASLALMISSSAVAQTPKEWIERALSAFEQAPFQLEFSVAMTVKQPQTTVRMDSQGTFLYLDPRHSVTRMQSTMSANSGATQSSTSHAIADGEHTWAFSIADGESKPTQILRSSLDELEARAAAEGTSLDASGDPLSQLRTLAANVDLTLVDSSDTLVRLQGTFADELPQGLSQQLAMFGEGPRLVVTLDRRTGEPREMSLGPPGEPVLEVTFNRLQFLDDSAVPRSSFAFQPPTGVPVFSP